MTRIETNITLDPERELREEMMSNKSLDFKSGILVEKKNSPSKKKKSVEFKDEPEEPVYQTSQTHQLLKKRRIVEIRQTVLQVESQNLIELVISNLQGNTNMFTDSTMKFAHYMIVNDLLKDKELNLIDTALKKILLDDKNVTPDVV